MSQKPAPPGGRRVLHGKKAEDSPSLPTHTVQSIEWKALRAVGKVLYKYDAQGEHQISLNSGDLVDIFEESVGWYRVELQNDSTKKGIFPANYIEIQDQPSESKSQEITESKEVKIVEQGESKEVKQIEQTILPEVKAPACGNNQNKLPTQTLETKLTPTDLRNSSDEYLLQEIVHVMNEWTNQMKQHLKNGQIQQCHQIKDRMQTLLEWRRQFTAPSSNSETRDLVKGSILKLIESIRRMREGYTVPRNDAGELATEQNTGVMQLYKLHQQMQLKLEEGAHLPGRADENLTSIVRRNTTATGVTKDTRQSILQTNEPVPTSSTHAPPVTPILQILLEFKLAMFQIGEPTELFFALYSSSEDCFITEEFFVSLTEQGMPEDVSLLGNLKTIFRDIEHSHLKEGLYLVCRIYRKGDLVYDEHKAGSAGAKFTKGKDQADYRRPFGCAVLSLSTAEIMEHMENESEYETPPVEIVAPTTELNFAALHKAVVQGDRSLFEPIPRAKGVALVLTLIKRDYAALERRYPHLVQNVIHTPKLLFTGLLNPGDERNHVYVTITTGEFLQDRKTSAKNVMITMDVLMDTGDTVDCLVRGTGPQSIPSSRYNSTVYYHSNTPNFHECVRLNIPSQHGKFERSHLLLTFYHCSTNKSKTHPFAFGFLRLTNDKGVVLPDGDHEVYTYKPIPGLERGTLLPTYLNPEAPGSSKLVARRGEVFHVVTQLCSSKKTQNEDLHDLLEWRQESDERIKHVLGRITYMADTEIVKFIREIFEVLFSLIMSKADHQMHRLVLEALVFILNILTTKFTTFTTIIDSYIKDFFRVPKAHETMLSFVRTHIEWAFTPDAKAGDQERRTLNNSLKCLRYLFKFIVASRLREKEQHGANASAEALFKDSVNRIFALLSQLMEQTSPEWLIGIQTLALKNIDSIFPELVQVFPEVELATNAKQFLAAVPSGRGNIDTAKLIVIKNIVSGAVFHDDEGRNLLLEDIVDIVSIHINQSLEERVLCISIIKEVASVVQNSRNSEHCAALLRLLPGLCSAMLVLNETTEQQRRAQIDKTKVPPQILRDVREVSDVATALINIIYIATDEQLQAMIHSDRVFKSREEIVSFMAQILHVGQLLSSVNLYPDVWLVMFMLLYTTLVKILRWLSQPLIEFQNQEEDLEKQSNNPWKLYFSLTMKILSAQLFEPSSSADGATNSRQQFITTRYGDIRNELCALAHQSWTALGRLQVHLIDTLVMPLLALTESSSQATRMLVGDIYFDMLREEYSATQSFHRVERQTIDSVDRIVQKRASMGSDADADEPGFMDLFQNQLSAKFTADATLAQPGQEFLREINQLFELLSSLNRFPKTAAYEDERTWATRRLMAYLQKTKRFDNYIKYVHQLTELHVAFGNLAEAGKTLLLHAKVLCEFDPTMPLEPVPEANYPSELPDERRERIYRKAIEYFNQGKHWELAIELCRNLRDRFETQTYNFIELSACLRQQADFFDKIRETERFYPSHFRVAFYGQGFPADYRNKEFVYRGAELESIMDFSSRIRAKFPTAQILAPSKDPTEDMLNGEDLYIQYVAVTPSTIEESRGLPKPQINSKMPNKVIKYKENNNVKIFFYTVPFRKRKEKSKNEFLDLWVRKKFIIIEETFPATYRRAQVVDHAQVELNPLENAVYSVIEKNKEMNEKINETDKLPDRQADSSFSMMINGVVDAAVNGGTKSYETFLTGEFETTNPEIKEDLDNNPSKCALVSMLKVALRNQLEILRRGVAVHSIKCSEQMLPLHQHMEEFFHKMCNEMSPILS